MIYIDIKHRNLKTRIHLKAKQIVSQRRGRQNKLCLRLLSFPL